MTSQEPERREERTPFLGSDAPAVRAKVVTARAEAARREMDLRRRADDMKRDLDAARAAMEADFRRRQSEIEEQLRPLKAELARLEEITWTVDLYMGRDEEVTLLRDGEPAPAGTPIVIRQTVQAADEEALLLIEEGGIDYRRMDAFIEWVAADPAHMSRIIPDQKGVVVVVPTRQRRDYGDGYHNMMADQANKRAHWLLRNGERLYLLVTDEKMNVGDRLLPARDEFSAIFTKPDWNGGRVPLTPGSSAWLDAEKLAGAVQRHYMRKMLVLQGLIDRSVVWRPLPAPTVNLLSVASQDLGYVRLVQEGDMALGDGRPRFREWQQALTGRLRPGMRVVLSTGCDAWRSESLDDRQWHDYGHKRVYPPRASWPPEGEPLLIDKRSGSDFVVHYKRTDRVLRRDVPIPDQPGYVWSGLTEVEPSVRATCSIRPGDEFVIPFDLATEEDLRYYLNSREDRKNYLEMVPVLRSALAAKQAEREAEAPFRLLLAGAIMSAYPDADPAQVERDVPDLVWWWKTSGKNARALTGDPEHEAKAVRAIVAEWDLRRRNAGDPEANRKAVQSALSQLGRNAVLAVALLRSGAYKAWTASGDGTPYLDEHTLDRREGSWSVAGRWTTVHPRTLATMRTLWSAERWQWHDLYPAVGEILTGPERSILMTRLRERMEADGSAPIVILDYPGSFDRRFITGYGWAPGADLSDLSKRLRKVDEYLTAYRVTWARDREGNVTTETGTVWPHWEKYTFWPSFVPQPETRDQFGRMSWPWREDDGRWERPVERLAWHDADQVRRLVGLYESLRERRRMDHEASIGAANRPYAASIERAARAAWLREKTAEARRRFDEDFGADAGEELWLHHLGTLALERAYKEPRWLDGMAGRLARARADVDGKTFAEIAELDSTLWVCARPVDVGAWGPWRIELEKNGEGA
jgi:hypothetical protein